MAVRTERAVIVDGVVIAVLCDDGTLYPSMYRPGWFYRYQPGRDCNKEIPQLNFRPDNGLRGYINYRAGLEKLREYGIKFDIIRRIVD